MKKTLDANKLKLIAIIAMTLDHIAWLLFPGYSDGALPVVMHIIGRLTCPIMCYFIAEGYYHTRNIRKYTFRLFLFAVISHFAYIFASNDFVDARSFIPFYFGSILNQTSVMWPLAWGLVMLRVANSERFTQLQKTLLVILTERLELHCKPVRAGIRHEPGRSEGAGPVDAVFCGDLCSRVFLRARQALRHFAAGRRAVPAAARAL